MTNGRVDGPLSIADRAVALAAAAGADEVEAVVSVERAQLTRFANSEIHQNVAETNRAINLRVVRASMLEELNRDYVRTLYAKGLSEGRIIWIHVLRNALPPIIALAGVMLRTLLGYTLIVETIFRWPGLGYQLVNAVLKRDYTVAQTLAILLTAAVILFNLLADIGQQWADPRVRQGARSS